MSPTPPQTTQLPTPPASVLQSSPAPRRSPAPQNTRKRSTVKSFKKVAILPSKKLPKGCTWRPGTKGVPTPEFIHRERRRRPTAEVERYQEDLGLVFSISSFHRLILEILQDMGKEDIRVSRSVAMAIQWVIEDFLVKEYIQAHYMMIHAGRKSLMGKDLHLVREQRRFREGFFICYNEPEDVRPQCAKKNKEENKKVTDGMVSKVAEAQGSGGVISSRGSPTSEAPNGENG